MRMVGILRPSQHESAYPSSLIKPDRHHPRQAPSLSRTNLYGRRPVRKFVAAHAFRRERLLMHGFVLKIGSLPHLFDVVELAHLRPEHVDDDIARVDQNPVCTRQALHAWSAVP